MSFFGGLFTGSNPTLNTDISQSGQISDYGTTLGEGDLSQASNFYSDLLSGDPSKIGQILGPQLSNIQQQGQQQLNTNAQFGNRSGGTNASNQTNMDSQRQQVEQMIAQLTGSAASGLTGIGENALSTGLSANQIQEGESQQRLKNQDDSILGGLFGGGVSALADFGESELFGMGTGSGGGDGGGFDPNVGFQPSDINAAPTNAAGVPGTLGF